MSVNLAHPIEDKNSNNSKYYLSYSRPRRIEPSRPLPAKPPDRSPIPFSVTKKYRHLLKNPEKYKKFVARIAKKYGAYSSAIKIPGRISRRFGFTEEKPIEVDYIRKLSRKTTEEDLNIQKLIRKKVAPAIVHVGGWNKNGQRWSGSGSIINLSEAFPGHQFPSNAYGIITNNHVTPKDTKYLAITLSDDTVIRDVKVLGSRFLINGVRPNVQDDKVDASMIIVRSDVKLPTLPIAKELPEIGEPVITAGHPQGLPRAAFTFGRVSHNNQETGAAIFVVQHDAAINPGNSGGPLINMRGEIVGLNTFTFRGGDDMSFAMPIGEQLTALRAIYRYGEYVRGDFGFSISALSPYEKYKLEQKHQNIPVNSPAVKISWVNHNSEAYDIGIRARDIITRIVADDGTTLNLNIDNKFEVTRFLAWMHKKRPGTRVFVELYHYEKQGNRERYIPKTLPITVGKLNSEKKSLKSNTWGFLVEKKGKKGTPVITGVDAGTPAGMKGLKAGEWVLAGIHAPGLSDKPIKVKGLNRLKEILISLRESDVKELKLYVINLRNPNIKTVIKLER